MIDWLFDWLICVNPHSKWHSTTDRISRIGWHQHLRHGVEFGPPHLPHPLLPKVSHSLFLDEHSSSQKDEITVCVQQNWTCYLSAVHGLSGSVQKQDQPEPRVSAASQRRGSRRGLHAFRRFLRTPAARWDQGDLRKNHHLHILWTKTNLNVSITDVYLKSWIPVLQCSTWHFF